MSEFSLPESSPLSETGMADAEPARTAPPQPEGTLTTWTVQNQASQNGDEIKEKASRAASPRPPENRDDESISDIFEDMLDCWEDERISLGGLIDYLGDRGFGLIILILALPNLIPVPVPIASVITGPPLIAFGYQLVRGHKHPWLPGFLARRSISHSDFTHVVSRSRKYLDRIEKIIRPRMRPFIGASAERFIGIVVFVMAILVAIPLPWTNWFPALSMVLFSLALIQRDGLLSVCGAGAAVFAFGFIMTLAGFLLEILSRLLHQIALLF